MRTLRRRDRFGVDTLRVLDHVTDPATVDRFAPGLRAKIDRQVAGALRSLGPGRFEPLTRTLDLTPEALQHEYVAHSRPVVLARAAASWPSRRRWTLAWLAERYPDTPVRLMHASVSDVGGPTRDAGEVRLGPVLDDIIAGRTDAYPRFVPLLTQHPELLDDLDLAWLDARRGRPSFGRNLQLFLGGPGSDTALHNAAGSNLFVQLQGRKHWRIIPASMTPALVPELDRAPYFFTELDLDRPDDLRYPLADTLRGWEGVLEPGDVLYVPPFAWHAVRNLDHSVGLGYRWYAPGALLRSSPIHLLLTLMSTQPPLWQAARLRHDFARVFAAGGARGTAG